MTTISLGQSVARIERAGSTEDRTFLYHSTLEHLIVGLDDTDAVEVGFFYGPFGEILQEVGAASSFDRQFNDKHHDDISALSYYGYRYYDSLSLSWTQADPLYRFEPDRHWSEPRRANLYVFSGNNPMRYYDPDGRELVDNGTGHLTKSGAEHAYGMRAGVEGAIQGAKVAAKLVVAVGAALIPDGEDVALFAAGASADGPLPFGDGVAAGVVVGRKAGKVGRAVAKVLDDAADGLRKSVKGEGGTVYLRTNKKTGGEYVGQAKSGRFDARKAEHREANPDADYEFDVLEEVSPGSGRSLDVAEEDWIRAGGGPKVLKNTRHQMSEKRYRKAGGNISKE